MLGSILLLPISILLISVGLPTLIIILASIGILISGVMYFYPPNNSCTTTASSTASIMEWTIGLSSVSSSLSTDDVRPYEVVTQQQLAQQQQCEYYYHSGDSCRRWSSLSSSSSSLLSPFRFQCNYNNNNTKYYSNEYGFNHHNDYSRRRCSTDSISSTTSTNSSYSTSSTGTPNHPMSIITAALPLQRRRVRFAE